MEKEDRKALRNTKGGGHKGNCRERERERVKSKSILERKEKKRK